MGNRFKLGKKRLATILLSALICCIFAFGGFFYLKNYKDDFANARVDSTTLDLDRGNYGINKENVKKLMQKIGNTNTKTYSSLSSYLGTNGTRNAGQILTTVTFAGLKWNVVYASRAQYGENEKGGKAVGEKGDIIVTLWLADTTGAGVNTDRKYYFSAGGTSCNTNSLKDTTGIYSYPTSMYSSSHVRAQLNGTNYADYGIALGTYVAMSAGNKVTIRNGSSKQESVWKELITNYGDYISTPNQVGWQQKQFINSHPNGGWTDNVFRYSLPNEGLYADGGRWNKPLGGASGETMNYGSFGNSANKTNYSAWGDDKVWLPSLYETGYAASDTDSTHLGLWKTTVNQRTCSSSSTWLRSGGFEYASTACSLLAAGTYKDPHNVHGGEGVRPAIHLNLAKIAKFGVGVPEATEEAGTENGNNDKLVFNTSLQNAVIFDGYGSYISKVEYTDTKNNVTAANYNADGTVTNAAYEGTDGVSKPLEGDELTAAIAKWKIDGDGGIFSAKDAGSYKLTAELREPIWDGTTYFDGETVQTFTTPPADLNLYTPWEGDAATGQEPNYWVKYNSDGTESWSIGTQTASFTVNKGTFTPSSNGITFPNKTTAYTGTVLTSGTTVSGTLPEGVTAAYSYTYVPANNPTATPVAATGIKNAGVYKVTAAFNVDNNWNEITETLESTYTVTQLTPTVEGVALKYPDRAVYAQGRLPALDFTSSSVPGSVAIKKDTIINEGTGNYPWIFTPTDEVNYECVNGTISITAIKSTGLPYPTAVAGDKTYKGEFYEVAEFSDPEVIAVAAIYWRVNGSQEAHSLIYQRDSSTSLGMTMFNGIDYSGWYKIDSAAGKVSLINAGEYIVEFKLTGERIWNGVGDDPQPEDTYWTGGDDPLTAEDERIANKRVEATISPKGVTVDWDFGDALKNEESGTYYWVYDGKEHIPTGNLVGLCARDDYGATVGLSFTRQNTTVKTGAVRDVTAGDYKMTAKLDFSAITSPDYLLHVQNNYRLITGEDSDGNPIIAEDAAAKVETTYAIRKRQLKAEWTGAGSFVYDGEQHAATATLVAGTDGGILAADKEGVLSASSFWVEYTSAETTASLSAPVNVAMDGGAAAPWTATAVLKHLNYELDAAYTCEITITPKQVSVVWSGDTADAGEWKWTYDGTHLAPKVSVDGLVGADDLKLAITYNGAATAIDAGKYTAVASKSTLNSPYITNNYTLDAGTLEQEFEIVKRKVTVSWALPIGDLDGVLQDGVFVWEYDGVKHVPVPSVTARQGATTVNLTLTSVGEGNSAVSTSVYTATAALDTSDSLNKNYVLDGTADSQQYKIIKRVIHGDDVAWSRDGHTLVPNDLSIDWGVLVGGNTPNYAAEANLATAGGVSWAFTTADSATSADLKLTVAYYQNNGSAANFADGVEWRAGAYYAKLRLPTAAAQSFEFEDGADTVLFKVVSVSGSKLPVNVLWVIAQRDNGGNISSYTLFDATAATPFIYNGSAQAPAAIFINSEGETVELQINDYSGNKNAGEYTVYLLPSEQYSFDSYVCEYTIRRLKVKLDWTVNSSRGNRFEWVYNGGKIAPAVEFDGDYFDEGMARGDYQDLLYNVLRDEAKIKTSGEVNAGLNLTARATLTDNFEIIDGTAEQKFDILKYELNSNNISWSAKKNGDSAYIEGVETTDTSGKVTAVRWDYDAKTHKPKATAKVKIYVDGALQEVVLTLLVSGETAEPGVHTAYAALDSSVELHGNFALNDTVGLTFNIAAMVIDNVHWTGDGDSRVTDGIILWTYDGAEHLPKAYFVPAGKTYDPADDTTFVWLNVEGARTDAGRYVATVTDDFTFTDVSAKQCVFGIEKAPLNIVWSFDGATYNSETGTYSWVYDGLKHAPKIDTLYGVRGEEIEYSISSFIVAGVHESVLKINNDNYTVASGSQGAQKFTIERADVSDFYEWISEKVVDGAYQFVWQYNGVKPVMELALADAGVKYVLYAGTAQATEVDFGFEYEIVETKGVHRAVAKLKTAQTTGGEELDIRNFALSADKSFKTYEITAFEITVEWVWGDALYNAETDTYYWVYDGAEHAPTAKYKDWNGTDITAAVDKRTNANSYTATLSLPTNCTFKVVDGKSTGECAFEITKAPVEVEWKFDEKAALNSESGRYYWVYDGTEHAPKAYIKDTETELTVSGGATDAGNGHVATAALTDAANYEFKNESDSVCKFDIRVKEVYVLWVDNSPKPDDKPFTWIFNNRENKPQAFLAELKDGELEEIKEGGISLEITVSGGQVDANAEAASYTARAEDTFNNYAFAAGAKTTQKFTILKKSLESELRWTDGDKLLDGKYTYAYNGEAQGPQVNISGREFEYVYRNAAGDEIVKIENAGEYTITAACKDTNYYIPAALATVTVKINAFEIDVKWTGERDGAVALEYTGYNVQPEAYYIDAAGNTVTLDVSVPTAYHTDTGEYEARAAFKTVTSNYALPADPTVKFNIVPKTVKIEWDEEAHTCYYDGNPHGAEFAATLESAITADVTGNLTVNYVLKQGTKTLTEREVVNAGSYTVEITLSGSAAKNYKLSNAKYGFRIAKQALTITVDRKEVNYCDPAPAYTAVILGAIAGEETSVKESVEKCLTSEYTSRSLPNGDGYAIELNASRLLTLLPNYTVDSYVGNVVMVATADGVVYWVHNDVKVVDDEFVFEYNGAEQRLNGYYLQGGRRVDIDAGDVAYMLYNTATDEYTAAPDGYTAVNAGTYYLKAADQGGFNFGDSAYVKYKIAPREIQVNLNRIEQVYGTVDRDGNEIVLLPDELLQASWSYGTDVRPVEGDDFNILISSNAYDEGNKVNGFVQANSYYIYGRFEGSENYKVTFVGVDNDEAPAEHKDYGVYNVAKAKIIDKSTQGTQWFYDEYVIEQYQKYFIRIEDKDADGKYLFVNYSGDPTAEVKFSYSDPYLLSEAPAPDASESYHNTKTQIGIGAQGEWAINYRIEVANHEVYYGQWQVLIKLADEYVVIIVEKPYEVSYGDGVPENLTEILVDGGYVSFGGAIDSHDRDRFLSLAEAYVPLGYNMLVNNRTPVGEYNILFKLNVPENSPLSVIYKRSNADEDSNIGKYVITPRKLNVTWGETSFVYDGETHLCVPVITNWLDSNMSLSMTDITNGKQYTLTDGGQLITVTVTTEGDFKSVGGHEITIKVNSGNYTLSVDDAAKAVSIVGLEAETEKGLPRWLIWLIVGLGAATALAIVAIIILAKRKGGGTVYMQSGDDDGFYDDANTDDPLGFNDPYEQE